MLILLFVGPPYPPYNLIILENGLSLVATWNKPFSLRGENLSYVISITNLDGGMVNEVIVNTTNYTLVKQDGQDDCAEYQFTVFSKNGYSRSMNAVSGRRRFPAGNTDVCMTLCVWINLIHSLSICSIYCVYASTIIIVIQSIL